MEINNPAGFWKRFLAKMIDFLIITLFSIAILFILKKNQAKFSNPWQFYLWSLLTVLIIFIVMIAIPLKTKGSSIGMFVFRIKTTSTKNIYKTILQKEIPYSFAWIFIVLLTMSVINHTLIYKVAIIKGATKKGAVVLTSWENTRISICGSLSGLISFLQMWLAITIIPKKNKRGWLDIWSHASVISTKQKTKVNAEKEDTIISPIKVNKQPLIWEGW